jgi:hypothetical protein
VPRHLTAITKKLVAITALGAAVGVPLALVETPAPAQAASTATIVGTATRNAATGTIRVPGAAVYLFQWNGSSWVNLGRKATANSSGNYAISVPAGPAYFVEAVHSYGACGTGNPLAQYVGTSVWFWTYAGKTVNAAIPMSFYQYIYC